ncbi:MAG: hypothetical protein CVT49_11870 [candidate division Zixibacteria bacterium HGW-Zixibacteria-1]|nr:MAG: hypothetical protein CVT49_11870 [candidate division Zixibacteria bacterium HGW-Zixibacteria-1]
MFLETKYKNVLNGFGKYIIIFTIALLSSYLAYGQSNDPQSNRPPSSSHFVEKDDWKALNPEPFDGCDIIINHNASTDKLTIEVVLHNLGYYSQIMVVDSAVYVNINCIAKSVAARSAANTLIPHVFDLYVKIDDCDTAQFKVKYSEDSLQVVAKSHSKHVRIMPIKKIPVPLCWMQFTGNQHSLIGDIENEISGRSSIMILEKGYYLDFPLEVKEEQYRKHFYNTTEIGTVIYLQSDSVSFPAFFDKLVSKYISRGLAGYGCLQDIKKE